MALKDWKKINSGLYVNLKNKSKIRINYYMGFYTISVSGKGNISGDDMLTRSQAIQEIKSYMRTH